MAWGNQLTEVERPYFITVYHANLAC
uniref:Uncharacterized protein n=1 Tax=Arundo donax TaxID=35708 RepID=A0A0A9BRW4_ARUDO